MKYDQEDFPDKVVWQGYCESGKTFGTRDFYKAGTALACRYQRGWDMGRKEIGAEEPRPFDEVLAKANQDFGLSLTVEKEKAGYFMLSPGGTLGGPNCGYRSPARNFFVELPNGWGYLLIKGSWYRLRDGCVGYRQGEECSFGSTLENAPDRVDPWSYK